jgi:outer membrane protein TolC
MVMLVTTGSAQTTFLKTQKGVTPQEVVTVQSLVTVQDAVNRALNTYPAVRHSVEQVYAAAAGIGLARTAYLPRADFLWQSNRATHNNVFGMMLPQSILPSISGPALGTNSVQSDWGSAVGTLVQWEPFDFGLRRASVDLAASARDRAAAQVDVTKLQVAAAAADGFLTILAAQQTVAAANAAVERARVLNETVQVMATNQLRPGADAARARAELALAETQLIRAQQSVDVGKAALAQLLGVSSQSLSLQSGPLLQPPPQEVLAAFDPARHPQAVAQTQAVNIVRAREEVLNRSYYPHFILQGTSYARGTSLRPDGTLGGVSNGFSPNTQNWGLGITVTFPLFDFASIRERKKVEAYNERAESARYEQIIQDLNGQMEQARATLTAARRVAQNTPIELEAARTSEQQANARYKAGLGNIIEVAEAERILAQAEIDDALARLGVWRALLAVEIAAGDVQPFLNQAK